MKTLKAAKYISLRNFVKLTEADKKKIEKQLIEKAREELAKSEDPVEKTCERKTTANIMLKVEVALRPVIKDEAGLDISKINFGK